MEYFNHESAIIDSDCIIGKGTKIWHFSHIMSNSTIGENCNIGQNVVVSPGVILGNNVKIQNNVSLYTGVIGWISEFGHRLNFDENNKAICPESKDIYELLNNQVIKI